MILTSLLALIMFDVHLEPFLAMRFFDFEFIVDLTLRLNGSAVLASLFDGYADSVVQFSIPSIV